MPCVVINKLSRSFIHKKGLWEKTIHHAVSDVCLCLAQGQTLGLVGESGCGKSTLAKMAVGLLSPTEGTVHIMGKPLFVPGARNRLRPSSIQRQSSMIFQNPYSSLNPRMSIEESIEEPLICQPTPPSRPERQRLVQDILNKTGIGVTSYPRYPHEFSGGQRQRIAIARALITRPAFLVCDEPTSSLDVSIQAQILNLLMDLQEEFGLTYLFISHDLGIVRSMSDQVAVMYAGKIVETGTASTLFSAPAHPYTRLLLDSAPPYGQKAGLVQRPDLPLHEQHEGEFIHQQGQGACDFMPRCPHRMPQCAKKTPQLAAVSTAQQTQAHSADAHMVRCFLWQQSH